MKQPLSMYEIGGIIFVVYLVVKIFEGLFFKMLDIISRKRNGNNKSSDYVIRDLCDERHERIGNDMSEIKTTLNNFAVPATLDMKELAKELSKYLEIEASKRM